MSAKKLFKNNSLADMNFINKNEMNVKIQLPQPPTNPPQTPSNPSP